MKTESIVKGKTPKQVNKLNLTGKNLTEIPSFVFEYTNLTKLVLSRNAIRRIPKEIASLRKLEVLEMTYNELNEFLSNYFSKKLDEEIDKLWADGSLNENKIESFRQ